MLPTPNFQVSQDCEVKRQSGQTETLKAWSFVRPIEYSNLPLHIKNEYKSTDQILTDHSFCYTTYGIVLIADKLIEKV